MVTGRKKTKRDKFEEQLFRKTQVDADLDDEQMERFEKERHRLVVLKSDDMSEYEPDYERRGTLC